MQFANYTGDVLMKKILEIKNLKKYFGEVKAVDGISFSVNEGELFSFLGLNGAGKSTTINMICGVCQKDFGDIWIDGENVEESNQYKSKIGVVYQDSVLDKRLSVKDNLESRAALYGIYGKDFERRVEEIDKLFDIKELLKRPVGKLSGGQRRRIDIARAIIHNPKLLILDEPTTGLDTQTRKTVWEALNFMRKEFGTTIFLTTHYMEEAADSNNIIIIDNGKIVAQGSPLALKNKYTGDFIKLYNTTESKVKKLKVAYEVLPECFKIEVKSTAEATNLILNNPTIFKDYEIEKGKIDDVFLSVTGKNIYGDNK